MRSWSLVAPVVLLVTTLGCMGKDPYNPGERVGTFQVTAKLVTSSCGDAPNPWEFQVKLSRDPSTLYWVQGGLPVQGSIRPGGAVTMTSKDQRTVRAEDSKRKVVACALSREDILEAKLEDDPLTRLSGTLQYKFAATEGSDCSDQTQANGGEFSTLPCDVQYTLSAQKVAGP